MMIVMMMTAGKLNTASGNVVTQPAMQPIHFALRNARGAHILHSHIMRASPQAMKQIKTNQIIAGCDFWLAHT